MNDKYVITKKCIDLLKREFGNFGDFVGSAMLMNIDLKKKQDREWVEEQVRFMRDMFDASLEELNSTRKSR